MAYRKTNDEFIKELNDLNDFKDYQVLDKYEKSTIKIRFKHLSCGNVFSMLPGCFLRGQRCPQCRQKEAQKHRLEHDTQKFLANFKQMSNNEYTLLGNYINATTKIKFKHLRCNNCFYMSPHHFIDDHARCPFCYGTPRKTIDEFKNQLSKLYGSRYTILDTKYVNTETHIKCKCNICGHVWRPTPANLLRGYGCPACSYSKGEQLIKHILDSEDIEYKSPVSFSDLVDAGRLRYDFYLPSFKVLIEYQGIQHYKPVDYFGGENQLKKQQLHDQMKRIYAKKHGYNLIEVSYKLNTFDSIKNTIISKVESLTKD